MKVTIHNLHKATAQQVFDTITDHLINQGKKATPSDGERCRYRTPENLTCAAGCLVPKADYEAKGVVNNEGQNWDHLCGIHNFSTLHAMLIGRLQDIHDLTDASNWPRRFQDLAREEGLNFSLVGES